MPQANSLSITPALARALTPDARQKLEVAIEALVAILDEADGEPDLEENGDLEPDEDGEPALGWPEDKNQDRALCNVVRSDAAGVPDGELDDADMEPSLGSRGGTYDADYFDQSDWAGGSTNDAEGDEHDGREPDVDGEYEMGWPEMIDQERAARSMRGTVNLGGNQWWSAYSDGEPSLGSSEQIDQRGWSRGGTRDLEAECEDEGAQCEDEGAQVD